MDDVINVSGHRIGTAEVESALASHPACAEAAVVGYDHPIKGQGIYAYVTLMDSMENGTMMDTIEVGDRPSHGACTSHGAGPHPSHALILALTLVLTLLQGEEYESGNDTPDIAALKKELLASVRNTIGAFAAPDVIHWAPRYAAPSRLVAVTSRGHIQLMCVPL